MNSRYRLKRNRLVAWLGILAMWLAVVAPVISQTLAASAREAFLVAQAWPLCTAHDHQHAEVVSYEADAHAAAGAHAHAGLRPWIDGRSDNQSTSQSTDSAADPAAYPVADATVHQTSKPDVRADLVSAMSGMPGMDHQTDSHGGACAYCGLLSDHPPVASAVPALFVGTADLVQSVGTTTASAFVARHYDASQPRAPPSFVS